TGAMSCNPAIGGLAKGQIVREVDALGGLMGLATDATGIQFRMLNASKGPAVQGPRAQCDKYRYAAEVQRLLATRKNLTTIAGTVERIIVEGDKVTGVVIRSSIAPGGSRRVSANSERCDFERTRRLPPGAIENNQTCEQLTLHCSAVVLTTGTFMRALMHTGGRQTEGGRVGEGTAVGISGA